MRCCRARNDSVPPRRARVWRGLPQGAQAACVERMTGFEPATLTLAR